MYSSRDDKVHPTLERSDRIGTRQDTSLPGSSQYQGSNYPNSGGNPRDDNSSYSRQDDRTWGEKAKDMVGMGPHSHGTTGSYDNTGYGTDPNTGSSYGTSTTNPSATSYRAGNQYGDNSSYEHRQDDRTMGEKAKDTVGMGPHSHGTTGSYESSGGYGNNPNTGSSYGTGTTNQGSSSFQPGYETRSGLHGHNTTGGQYGDNNNAYGSRQEDRTMGEKAKDMVGVGPHSYGTTGSYDNTGYGNNPDTTGTSYGTTTTSRDDRTMGEKAKDTVGMGPHSHGTTGSYDNSGIRNNTSTKTTSDDNSYQPGSDLNSGLERTHIGDNQYGDNTSYGHRQDDRTMGEKAKDTVGMGPHSHGTTGSYDTSRNDDQRTSPYSGTVSISDNPSSIDNRSNTSTAGSSSNASSLGNTTTNPSGSLASGSHGTRTTNDTYGHHETGTTSNPSTSTSGAHAGTTGATATNDSNNNPEHKSFMTSMIDKAKHLVGKGHENDPAHQGGQDTAYDNDPNKLGTHNTDYDNDRNKHGKHKGHNKHEEANENNLFEPSLTNQ